MRGPLFLALVVLGVPSAYGQGTAKDRHRQELFTSYFSVSTPIAKAYIPAGTRRLIIGQADKLVSSPDGLKSLDGHDLPLAADNLRACATSELARFDRDLAVGLYGELVAEIARRERGGK